MMTGKWIDELMHSVGEYVRLETRDGVQREGKISGFELWSMEFNSVIVDIPKEVELNGDPNDRIPLERIKKISVG